MNERARIMLYQFSFHSNKTIKEKLIVFSHFHFFIIFVLSKQFQVIFSSRRSKYLCPRYASALLVQKAKELLISHVHSLHKNKLKKKRKNKSKIHQIYRSRSIKNLKLVHIVSSCSRVSPVSTKITYLVRNNRVRS